MKLLNLKLLFYFPNLSLEFFDIFGNLSDLQCTEVRKWKVLIHSLKTYERIFNDHPDTDPVWFSLALDYVLCKVKITPDFLQKGHHLKGKQCTYFDPIIVDIKVLPILENVNISEKDMGRILRSMVPSPTLKVT